MDNSRNGVIRQVVEQLSRPRTINAKDATYLVAKAVKQNNALERRGFEGWKPAEAVKLVKTLPPASRMALGAALEVHTEQLELGRHGDPKFVARATGFDPEVLDTLHDKLTDDYITLGVIERRGSDASLPPPPLTQRDHIEAAYLANGGDQE